MLNYNHRNKIVNQVACERPVAVQIGISILNLAISSSVISSRSVEANKPVKVVLLLEDQQSFGASASELWRSFPPWIVRVQIHYYKMIALARIQHLPREGACSSVCPSFKRPP